MKCHQQSFLSASFQVQRESSGTSWSVKAKGEEKASGRGEEEAGAQQGACFHTTGMLMVSLAPSVLEQGAPCLHDTGEQPQQSRSDGTHAAKLPSALGVEDQQSPLLHSWSAARGTAWGKALLYSDAKTPTSMSPKSHMALSGLSLRVCPLTLPNSDTVRTPRGR